MCSKSPIAGTVGTMWRLYILAYKYLCTWMVSPSKPVPFKFKLNFKLRLEYICKNTESTWYWIQRNNLYWVDTQKLFHHQICEDAVPPLPLYISLLNMKYPWGSFISSNSTGKRWKSCDLAVPSSAQAGFKLIQLKVAMEFQGNQLVLSS